MKGSQAHLWPSAPPLTASPHFQGHLRSGLSSCQFLSLSECVSLRMLFAINEFAKHITLTHSPR